MFQMGRSWLFERVNPTSRRFGPLRPFPRFIFDEPDGCFHAAQIAATSNLVAMATDLNSSAPHLSRILS